MNIDNKKSFTIPVLQSLFVIIVGYSKIHIRIKREEK
jgi:hypothetical protein